MYLVTYQGAHGEWRTEEFWTEGAAMRRVQELRENGHPEAQWKPKFDE